MFRRKVRALLAGAAIVPLALIGSATSASADASGGNCIFANLGSGGQPPKMCLQFSITGDGLKVEFGKMNGNPFTGYNHTEANLTVAGTICQPRIDLVYMDRAGNPYYRHNGQEAGGCYIASREYWGSFDSPTAFNAQPGWVCADVMSAGKFTGLSACHNLHD
ncbi:hypothetical protein GTQ99_00340 [Kineococcus sp. T13]|uniref:hypothetical protein n=1 Tax=Kineococcus vitellinus TaxID=2696565 RepID=UPI001412FD38|nr:hypothetical protein [Kineococcus vitellinus]NAZ73879.1 hypothetical protein [Kineococcus vitellinus]